MNMRTTASVFMIWSAICVYVDSCTFPSVLEGKTWEDSKKGRPVTFSGNVMIGWNVTAFSTVMNQWECLFNENDIIVSKSSFVFELFPGFPPTTYYVYICMWIVSLDSDKFIYYLLADFVSDFDTRAYKGTDDNLGPCDVCQLSLSLDPEDAKVMTSTGNFSQTDQPYSPVTCDSVLQTTVLSSTTITSETSEEPSSSESRTTGLTSTVDIKSSTAVKSTDLSTTSTNRETQVSSTETIIGSTTTKATTIESMTTETTSGSTTESTVGSTTESTVGSTTTISSTTTLLHTEPYATTKLSTTKSSTSRLNIVSSTTGYTIDSEKMVLPLMSNEAFITMVICGGLIVLVVLFITIIGVYSSLKSKQKPKNIRYRHNFYKYLTP